jgi:HlyD family secretion protein
MKKIIPIIVVLLLGYAAYVKWQGSHFRYTGTLEADETDISPGVTSQIDEVMVKEGDVVKAGQMLVKLQCQEVRINANDVQTDFARAEKLFAQGSMPKATYDQKRYAAQDASLKVSFCDITAPIDSTVVSVYRRKGEWTRPGVNLLTLEDLSHPYAYIYLPLPERNKLKLGQEVSGFMVGGDDKAYKGVVTFLRPDAEFTPKNVQTRDEQERLVFGVKIAFDNDDGRLAPGLPIEVKF